MVELSSFKCNAVSGKGAPAVPAAFEPLKSICQVPLFNLSFILLLLAESTNISSSFVDIEAAEPPFEILNPPVISVGAKSKLAYCL